MNIVVYKCDTCLRTFEKKQNKKGLDVIDRCTITDGCKGHLRFQQIKVGHSLPTPTVTDPTLSDWSQRKILHNHDQTIPDNVWIINHYLKSEPIVQAYVYNDDQELVKINQDNLNVEYNDENTLKLTFDVKCTGIVQCIARKSVKNTVTVKKVVKTVTTETTSIQLSVGKMIVLATTDTTAPEISLVLKSPSSAPSVYYDNVNLIGVDIISTTENDIPLVPWNKVKKILLNGKRYNVFGYVIPTNIFAIVNEGSYGYIVNTSTNQPFVDETNVLLMSNSPFDIIDKEVSQYGILNNMSLNNGLLISNNEIRISEQQLKSTYPSIKIVSYH